MCRLCKPNDTTPLRNRLQEIVTGDFDNPLEFRSQRDFVRKVLAKEAGLGAIGYDYYPKSQESAQTQRYRAMLNADGSPSDTVASGYVWSPGTELNRRNRTARSGAH